MALSNRYGLRVLLFCMVPAYSLMAEAGPYTDLIVLGDSLSDVGNTLANPLVDVFTGIDDFDNRFTNGPVYAEGLSEGLGLGSLTHSGTGGDNFAYGGAETDGPGGFTGFFLDSLVEQVDEYLDRLGSASADANALHVVFIGANDLLGGSTDTATPAGVVSTQLQRLVNAGAQQFLGVNLPLLGLTPRFNTNGSLASARSATAGAYNAALDDTYDAIETANAGTNIYSLDVETLFSDLVADPDPFGFTNVTTPGQDLAGSSFDRAPGYIFWDDVHPTREVHALLGEAALRAALPEGDYNRDGQVNAADYTTWATQYGVTFNAADGVTPSLAGDANGDGRINAADYTMWRDRPGPAAAVPEPSALLIAAITLALAPRKPAV